MVIVKEIAFAVDRNCLCGRRAPFDDELPLGLVVLISVDFEAALADQPCCSHRSRMKR